jgi:hypothetical protein
MTKETLSKLNILINSNQFTFFLQTEQILLLLRIAKQHLKHNLSR